MVLYVVARDIRLNGGQGLNINNALLSLQAMASG